MGYDADTIVSLEHVEVPGDFRSSVANASGLRVFRVAVTAEITDLDDVQQSFKSTGYVYAAWASDKPDADSLTPEDVKDESPVDMGACLFLNAFECETSDITVKRKGGQVYACIGYEATFGDLFRLQRFPYDRQLLTVVVQTVSSEPNVRVAAWTKADSMNSGWTSAQTWFGIMGGHAMNWHTFEPFIGFRKADTTYHFEMKMRLQRKPTHYVMNVGAPLYLLVVVCGLAFFLSPDDLASRFSVVMTLILAAVAFKFVINGYLPKVPYPTLLDGYVVIAFLVLCLIALENALVSVAVEHDIDIRKWDILFGAVLLGAWTVLNILVLLGERAQIFYADWEKELARPIEVDTYRYAPHDAPFRNMSIQ